MNPVLFKLEITLFNLEVNLARKPFRNRRLFWLLFAVSFSITLFLGAWAMRQTVDRQSRIQEVSAKIASQKRELEALSGKKIDGQLALTEAQSKRIRAAALLIRQRSFSWSAMLEEFEAALPSNIKISSIRLQKQDDEDRAFNPSGKVMLNVTLSAKTAEDVTKMIAQLDKQKIFDVNIKSETLKKDVGELSFELEVAYRPRPKKAAPVETAKLGRDR